MSITGLSSMRARPPTMARSSAEHAIAVQLVELAADEFGVVERVRPLRMARELRDLPGREVREDALVSCSALACRRVISSWMFTSESEARACSSSILASSSAIGCSKSRKCDGHGGPDPQGLIKAARGYGRGRPLTQGCRPRRRWWRHRYALAAVAAHELFELLDQLPRRPHLPLGPNEKAPRCRRAAYSTATAHEPPRQGVRISAARCERLRIRAPSSLQHHAAGLLLARLLELAHLAGAQHPAVAELVEAQLALDDHQRVLRDELAVLLEDIVETASLRAGRCRRPA